MLYFNFKDGNLINVGNADRQGTFQCRCDWKSLQQAQEMAAQANALKDGNTYHATDAGPSTSPRYDVQRVPKVGDKVSYSFNGDTYPDGEIVSISESLKLIRTSTGGAYYRRRQTGAWIKDQTWFLVAGHHETRNPHI